MTNSKTAPIDLAREARRFSADNNFDRDGGWSAVDDKSDLDGATVAISVRLPGRQLQLLKEFARREGVGYQTLMKRWLDDRLRDEFEAMREGKSSAERLKQLSKELEWASKEIVRVR